MIRVVSTGQIRGMICEIVAFWLNIVDSLPFGIFFLTLVSERQTAISCSTSILVHRSFVDVVFSSIHRVCLPDGVSRRPFYLTVNTLIRYAFTIMVFHRIPLFLDTIITVRFQRIRKIPSSLDAGPLVANILGVIRSVIGPCHRAFQRLVGGSFLCIYPYRKQQATELKGCVFS